MPHFDADGNDTVLCQCCGLVGPGASATWMEVPDGSGRNGQVCPRCKSRAENNLPPRLPTLAPGGDGLIPAPPEDSGPMGLMEYAALESGYAIGSPALRNYVNRHYGHD